MTWVVPLNLPTAMMAARFILVVCWCLLGPALSAQSTLPPPEGPLRSISFGSCNNQAQPQPMWQFVRQNQPQLWIWLGDNVYADTRNLELMRSKYQKQKNHPEYQKLRRDCQIIGTWDDHDYGVNDGGKEFPQRERSQQQLLDFLDVPAAAPARQRPGVYQAYTYGEGEQKVKVILLDTRYFRDSLRILGQGRTKRCLPNLEGDILGEAQWKWLRAQLTDSDASLHLIGSSIQVIPEQHRFEKWANFPGARSRLFELLRETQAAHVVFLSGDRHVAEVSRFELDGLATPLYEVTSSGITHTWREKREEDNRYRQGELIIERNFGVLQIDWSAERPRVIAEIRGVGNALLLQRELDWSPD